LTNPDGTERLALRTLARVPASARPLVDPRHLRTRIVHLGLGAFHRAHQAQYTEEAVAAAGGDWGIAGVTLRSRTVLDQLAAQDWLYSVLARDNDRSDVRVVAAIREAFFAGDEPAEVVRRIADPAVAVTTLTVTEKGYGPPVIGLLVRGIQARMRADAGPLAVVSCDNLAHNGSMLAGLVRDFVERLPPSERRPLESWIAPNVSFPSTMVDRIVPATTEADRAEVERLIGLRDEGAVATEPFRQWVVEDDFPAGRPAWERAGVVLTKDVRPYELIKLRMLNASHSALAYLGWPAGCDTIAAAMRDEGFATVVDRLMREDVRPTLDPPDGFDIDRYRDQLLNRFANAALRHRTEQVAMDGSQKLPQRLLPTLTERRAAGAEPRWAARVLAAWMCWVWLDRRADGTPRPLDDPLADVLQSAVAGASSARQVVDRLLGVRDVFDARFAEDDVIRKLLVEAVEQISRLGTARAARAWASESAQPEDRT
jgi:fructuronate reductase